MIRDLFNWLLQLNRQQSSTHDRQNQLLAEAEIDEMSITASITTAANDWRPSDASILLKEATAAKATGDMETAIHLLRKAYATIASTDTAYGVETFLRLPLYLQKAGRNDEAWREFNRLITHGYPNQVGGVVLPMDHSIIYDKMRLLLQREGKADTAVRFGVYSYICWGLGLYLQNRKQESNGYFSEESIEGVLASLLAKAKKSDCLQELVGVIAFETSIPESIDIADLGRKIDEIMFR